MGKLEQEHRKRTQKKDLQKFVLDAVAVGGVLSFSLVAPNAIAGMHALGLLPSIQQKSSINQTRDRLLKQGFLTKDRRGFLRISEQGKKKLEKIHAFERAREKPKRWDRRWRIVIFDIPQRRGSLRNNIRTSLRSIGFLLIQRSVWIYPYECEDYIALLKADLKIGKNLLYIIAETIEGDAPYRAHFNLS